MLHLGLEFGMKLMKEIRQRYMYMKTLNHRLKYIMMDLQNNRSFSDCTLRKLIRIFEVK